MAKIVESGKADFLKKFGFSEEELEEKPLGGYGPNVPFVYTGYPKPIKRYKIIWEVHNLSLEEPYYWILNYLQQDLAYPEILKTDDAFAAAENSAFFGVSQVRLGGQQDKVSQFLATIGKMVKELFQIVREMRILDERLEYYRDVGAQKKKPMKQRLKQSEITLKGIFIDLVQGGAKNPASVYGMARELEFTTLPDLYFEAPPFVDRQEMENWVSALDFNRKVKEVLRRHLNHFFEWKKRTWKEMTDRRKFTLKYLRQHWEIIRMYIAWVKPYLRHIERLTLREEHNATPEMVAAFENSMIDVEMMAIKPFGHVNSVFLVSFMYRTRPAMSFVQEGYQRGPIHVGKLTLHIRGYAWTREQIDQYRAMKQAEEFELLKRVSKSVESAMQSLGDELEKYLEEAGATLPWKTQTTKLRAQLKQEPIAGWRLFLKDFIPLTTGRKSKLKKPKQYDIDKDVAEVKTEIKKFMFLLFKNFKKSRQMVMW